MFMTIKTTDGSEVFLKVEEVQAIYGSPGKDYCQVIMNNLTLLVSEATVHAIKMAIMQSGQKQYIGNLP